MNGKLLINEVAALLAIEPSAIRYWEKKGLLHLQRDKSSGYRYFDSKALLEVLDIVFFRKLQLSVKVLGNHLTGNIDEREVILTNAKKDIIELINTFIKTEEAISFRLKHIQEIKELQMSSSIRTQKEIPFSIIESRDLLHENHTKQYLNDPSHFVLMFEGETQERIQEGIIIDEKEPIDKYILWKKNPTIESIYGGLLIVNVQNHQCNTLQKIRKELSIDSIFNQVIAQYLSSGKEEDVPVDYYQCWFVKAL